MGNDLDLSGVSTADVAAVLSRAADLLDQHGWSPAKSAPRLSALQAITKACDLVGGTGVVTAELHAACLDAVCLDVFGAQHGRGASVSRWERQVADEAAKAAVEAQAPAISGTLRRLAQT